MIDLDELDEVIGQLRKSMKDPVITAQYKRVLSKALKAAQAYLTLMSESAWQPIETAPRDGTEILVFCNFGIEKAWFGIDPNMEDAPEWLMGDGDDWSTGYYFTPVSPTHWMPLPEPPKSSE